MKYCISTQYIQMLLIMTHYHCKPFIIVYSTNKTHWKISGSGIGTQRRSSACLLNRTYWNNPSCGRNSHALPWRLILRWIESVCVTLLEYRNTFWRFDHFSRCKYLLTYNNISTSLYEIMLISVMNFRMFHIHCEWQLGYLKYFCHIGEHTLIGNVVILMNFSSLAAMEGFDIFQCSRWWKCRRNDDISVSV